MICYRLLGPIQNHPSYALQHQVAIFMYGHFSAYLLKALHSTYAAEPSSRGTLMQPALASSK